MTFARVVAAAALVLTACGDSDARVGDGAGPDGAQGDALGGGLQKVYVQYHTWWTVGACPSAAPASGFHHWAWSDEQNPCHTNGAPWLRDISSPGYPLIGIYRGDDAEVFRWHVRLAKAAGIDGFFVSIFANDPDTWAGFETALEVANQEGFAIGIEGWMPNPGQHDAWKADVLRQLQHFAVDSPNRDAFLRVDGRPAYWFNFNDRYMSDGELTAFLDAQSAHWFLVSGGTSGDWLRNLNGSLQRSRADVQVTWAFPHEGGFVPTGNFAGRMNELRQGGSRGIAHGYPGFDESRLGDRAVRRRGNRNGGETLRTVYRNAASAGAELLLIESFNDWTEYTMLEPGFDVIDHLNVGQEAIFQGDPYRSLKGLAELRGRTFVAPTVPCEIVDPALIAAGKTQCGGQAPAPPPPPPSPPTAEDAPTVQLRHAYLGILGRAADDGGLAAHRASLDHGATLASVCRGMWTSGEFAQQRGALNATELAEALYQGILGREGDPGGLEATRAEIAAGRGPERAANMLQSAEFAEKYLR